MANLQLFCSEVITRLYYLKKEKCDAEAFCEAWFSQLFTKIIKSFVMIRIIRLEIKSRRHGQQLIYYPQYIIQCILEIYR